MEKEELKQRCLDAIDANRDLIIHLVMMYIKRLNLATKNLRLQKE